MRQTAANAPVQLRKKLHIGSLMDIVYLDILQRHCHLDIDLAIGWNALGKFRVKDNTIAPKDMQMLYKNLSQLADDCLGGASKAWHFLDDDKITHDIVSELVLKLMSKGFIFVREYEAHYCECCESYLAPKNFVIEACKKCAKKPVIKMTTDLFIKVNKDYVRECVTMSHFEPSYTRNKFLGTLYKMPEVYAITKLREYGFPADIYDSRLAGKILDPKFISSLFPSIVVKLGHPPLGVIVIGEDILERYIYYLFANSSLFELLPLRIYVHGLLVSGNKKISKYGNLPVATDISNFLKQWTWEHLRLLCLSSKFGKNIDFEQKMKEVHKLIVKQQNVCRFLDSVVNADMLKNNNQSDSEQLILEHCQRLKACLPRFQLYDFYCGYQVLWFDLLSRQYIPQIKSGIASQSGLQKISATIKNLL